VYVEWDLLHLYIEDGKGNKTCFVLEKKKKNLSRPKLQHSVGIKSVGSLVSPRLSGKECWSVTILGVSIRVLIAEG